LATKNYGTLQCNVYLSFQLRKNQMKKLFNGLVLGLFLATFGSAAFAADKGSAGEAMAMVKKAVAYLKDNGKEKAFANSGMAPMRSFTIAICICLCMI